MVLIEEESSTSASGDRIEEEEKKAAAAASSCTIAKDASATTSAAEETKKAAAEETKKAAAEDAPAATTTAASAVEEEDEQPFEDALDEEQLQQRALSQANEAKVEGNRLFGAGSYDEALAKYELAMQLAPEGSLSTEIRSICHANRAACFSKLGKYDYTIKECTKALELNATYMKALVRRGEAHEKLEHYEEAISDMKKIIELDPSNVQASRSLRRLEPLAAEKREKMKEEMIGKLKDMGNSLLGRFGMSLDNFKAVKDPNSGSYSISFQQ